MPLFMVKKEVFEWIQTGQKNIELRRGKTEKGDVAVFQCGRNIEGCSFHPSIGHRCYPSYVYFNYLMRHFIHVVLF